MRLGSIGKAIKSLVWVLLAYGIYAVCVVPLVEPASQAESTAVSSADSVASRSTDRYVRELKSLFREGDWELQEPKVLRSDQATVLLKDYQVLKDGSLELTPCTLIFYGDRKKPADRGPLIMRAEGAQLVFDRPLDPRRMEVGKPLRGGLFGAIHIHSSGIPGKSESLDIFTRNLIITEQQTVRTREQVTFKIGAHQGSGRDLLLRRADAEPVSSAEDDPWLGGLGILELHHLDRLSVRLAGDKLFAAFGPAERSIPAATPTGVKISTVEVTSDGPLRFDFQNLIAKLDDNVRITRSQPGLRSDTIRADQISLHMERTTKQPAEVDSASTPAATSKRSVTVNRLIATGSPLIVDAPSEGAHVQAKRLEYDFSSGQINLKGFNPFAAAPRRESTSNVILRNQQHAISAPSVDIRMDSDAQISSLLAAGPGSYQGRPSLEGDIVNASWQSQLSLEPVEGNQRLRILGSSSISSEQFASIQAEQIDFWLRETTTRSRTASGHLIEKKEYVPSHVVAIGDGNSLVSIDSARIKGTLQSLTIVLSSTPADATGQAAAGSRPPQRQGSLLDGLGQPDSRKEPAQYRIEGGQLQAWIDTSQAKQPRLQRLVVEGPTQLWEDEHGSVGQDELLRISGNSIDYQESLAGKPVANVRGTPAVFQASGLHLRGDIIQVHGEENRVRVPGKGWLRLMVSADALSGNQQPPASSVPAPKTPIEVSWQESLNFDGLTATILDEVVVTGPDLNLQTSTVRIGLDRAIELARLGGDQARPEVAAIFADGGVLAAIRSRDEQNQTKSVQQIATKDLQLNNVSGDLVAQGPGWIAHTSYGSSISLTNPGSQPSSDADEGLSQMSLAFGKQLIGNLHRRESHFQGGIRAWFGTVSSWQERVDPLQERKLGPQDARMVCNELFVLESPGATRIENRGPIEIIARGDLQVVTEKYVAQGFEIKFAEEKDMVMLVGSGARPAEFWKRNPSGGPPAYSGQMGQIKFWPGTGDYEISELRGIDLTEVPTLSR